MPDSRFDFLVEYFKPDRCVYKLDASATELQSRVDTCEWTGVCKKEGGKGRESASDRRTGVNPR